MLKQNEFYLISIAGLMLLVLAELTKFACAQDIPQELQYKDRGGRSEGVISKPVGIGDIELKSAVTYREPTKIMPERLKIKFYLPTKFDVSVTVQEIEDRYFYLLNNVNKHWQIGFDNDFDWPTRDVIQRLNYLKPGGPLNIDDLGVLVLREPNKPGKDFVAPAIFYHTSLPDRLTAYRFLFQCRYDAILNYEIFKQKASEQIRVYSEPRVSCDGNAPLLITWDATDAAEGYYRLKIGGHFEGAPGERIKHTVKFYHQPSIKP